MSGLPALVNGQNAGLSVIVNFVGPGWRADEAAVMGGGAAKRAVLPSGYACWPGHAAFDLHGTCRVLPHVRGSAGRPAMAGDPACVRECGAWCGTRQDRQAGRVACVMAGCPAEGPESARGTAGCSARLCRFIGAYRGATGRGLCRRGRTAC